MKINIVLLAYFKNISSTKKTLPCNILVRYVSGHNCHTDEKVKKKIYNILQTMPKNKERETLRHVKLRENLRVPLPPPNRIDVQVIGSGGRGTPKTVMFTTDHMRYLFNCGESTQRIAGEQRMKLAKMENLFITQKTWDNVGGLLGMVLTQQAIGVPKLTIHGPPGVEKIIKMIRGFSVEKTDIQIEKRELTAGVYEDNCFKIEYVPIYKHSCDADLHKEAVSTKNDCSKEEMSVESTDCSAATSHKGDVDQQAPVLDGLSESSEENDITDPGGSQTECGKTLDRNVEERKMFDDSTHRASPSVKQFRDNEENLMIELHNPAKHPKNIDNLEMTVAYICTARAAQRKIIIEKCADLDVPVGPIMRLLKNEEIVTLEDGRVIHPDQVLTPYEAPSAIIVLECPDEDYMDKLVTREEFFTKPDGKSREVDLVIHMTPVDIVENGNYKAFMERFGETTKHLIFNESCSEVAFEGVYRIQAKLNLLHSDIFPLLPHQVDPMEIDVSREAKLVKAATNLIYQHRSSKKGFMTSECIELNNQSYLDEIVNGEGVPEKLTQLKDNLQKTELTGRRVYPEVVFLGTGSAVPSKERNVSANLLNIDDTTSVLIDCGEGTDGQLYRHYGDKTDEMLVKLKVICVTHLHADHHLGLFGILESRQKAFTKIGVPFTPVYLVAPIQISRWLQFYGRQIKSVHDQIRLAPSQRMRPFLTEDRYREEYKEIMLNCRLKTLIPVAVDHCWNAYGFVFEHEDGWKVVFSGDTMPCDRLVVAGENCDVLVHEATMEDDLIEDAKFKSHSTVSQAIDIGKKMCAKFTLLNHFSQRYAKIPIIDNKSVENVGIAFDNLRVSLHELPMLPKLIDTMKVIFAESYADLEKNMQKRNIRREREMKEELGAGSDNGKGHMSKKRKQNTSNLDGKSSHKNPKYKRKETAGSRDISKNSDKQSDSKDNNNDKIQLEQNL